MKLYRVYILSKITGEPIQTYWAGNKPEANRFVRPWKKNEYYGGHEVEQVNIKPDKPTLLRILNGDDPLVVEGAEVLEAAEA